MCDINRNCDIDRMRGLTVFLMLLVNSPVDLRITTATLKHSEWAGLTLADIIFPTFLFIVGVSLSLSHSVKKIKLNTIISKVIALFFTGLLLKTMTFTLFNQEHLRVMGVLQRIGICYGIVGLMLLYVNIKVIKFILCALILTWSLILFKWGNYNQYFNISDVFDGLVIGVHANYYDVNTGRYGDSEGILSTVGSVITTLLGVIFGKNINKISNAKGLCYGVFLILAGLVLFYFLSMPVIKKLWTPSFLLICAGISILIYICVRNVTFLNLTCLEYPGRHSLAIYVSSIILFEILLYLQVWHSLFVVIYTNLIPRSIPIQGATFIFSLLFSSVVCFVPYIIQKILTLNKRVV